MFPGKLQGYPSDFFSSSLTIRIWLIKNFLLFTFCLESEYKVFQLKIYQKQAEEVAQQWTHATSALVWWHVLILKALAMMPLLNHWDLKTNYMETISNNALLGKVEIPLAY